MIRGSVKQKSETHRLLVDGPLPVHLKAAATHRINPSATQVLEPHLTNHVLPAQHLIGTTKGLPLRKAEDEELVAEAAPKAKEKAKIKEKTKGRKETPNHRLVLPLQGLAPLADPQVVKSATFVVPS